MKRVNFFRIDYRLIKSFGWPEDTPMSAENKKVNSIIKKFAFHPSIKTMKTIKIKSEFSFSHEPRETMKRIINHLDVKKALSGKNSTFFF